MAKYRPRFAGANGSGKSTLLLIMAGLSGPSTGRVEGSVRIGYLPDPSISEALLDRLAVVGGPGALMGTLSKGNAQKVGLAQAFLGDPQLVILDEPWSGLDVEAHQVLAEMVAETRARGDSVVFTDHREAHVRRHADEVFLMLDGRIVEYTGSPAAHHVSPRPTRRLRIVVAGTAAASLAGEPECSRPVSMPAAPSLPLPPSTPTPSCYRCCALVGRPTR